MAPLTDTAQAAGPAPLTLAEWRRQVGAPVGVSRWLTVTQAMIDAHAATSGDGYWIHTDPGRAAAHAPSGTTIAHGFLTLSLLSALAQDAVPPLAGETLVLNYGLNRVRFVAPVPSGARIRARFALAALDDSRAGEVTFTHAVTVEIEGHDRPALVAEWLNRRYLETP